MIDDALAQADRADWRGRNWTRLAIIAALRERPGDAARLLQHAADVGDVGAAYYDALGRRALALGRPAECLPIAQQWQSVDRTDLRAALLASEAHTALDNYMEAESEVRRIGDADSLEAADDLRLGRVLVALDDWRGLARLLERLGPLAPEFGDEHDFLRAIRLTEDRKLTAALGILDFLHDRRPTDLDVAMRRGIVLLRANQLDEALRVFADVAKADPRRRDAWYWVAMADLQLDQADQARHHLNTAVSLSPRYLAAWEAWGALEVNAGQPQAAIPHLEQAVSIHPRRASAYLLMAIAQAKLDRRDEAVAALQTALQIDPALLAQARNAEVLTTIIDPAEMDRMAEAVAPDTPSSTLPLPAAETQPNRDE